MEDLKKIELTSKKEKEEISFSKSGKKFSLFSRRKGIIFGFLVIFALLTFFAVILPAQKTYVLAKNTFAQAKKAVDAVKKQNIELASVELEKTRKDIIATKKSLDSFSYLNFVPIVNFYYSDAEHLLQAGVYGLEGATVVVDSLKPYADVLGLKGQGSFVMGSAEQRIQTAVLTMGKITPKIDEITKSLKLAKEEIDAVSPDHYPSFFGGEKIKKQLKSFKEMADSGVTLADQARPLIKMLPSLLGESKDRRYLVLFQNDKEIRPTGGFITAYAIFRIDKGIIHVERSDDIYNLDKTLSLKSKPPRPIQMYLPKVTAFNLRDSNLSPDYVESMKTFESLYSKIKDKVDIDGIIALDTHVLVSTIKVLDDEVVAGGVTFTSKIDKRCNCPQVIYALESITDTPRSLDLRINSLESVQAQRKDILGILLYALMQKALKSSPKLYWGPLFQTMTNEANEKHLLVYLHDKDAQAGIEAIGVAGRIKPYDGDYLHVNDTNFGGAKSNMFVSESVAQDIKIGNDGVITKTLTISYKNPFPPSDCNLERGGLCLNAELRNWLRIYVPKGSTLVDSSGSEVKLTSYEELGKTVFEGFLTVKPEGMGTFKITYRLPFKLDKSSMLPLFIQKQPGTDKNNYTIKVNGKTTHTFDLISDKELKLKP